MTQEETREQGIEAVIAGVISTYPPHDASQEAFRVRARAALSAAFAVQEEPR